MLDVLRQPYPGLFAGQELGGVKLPAPELTIRTINHWLPRPNVNCQNVTPPLSRGARGQGSGVWRSILIVFISGARIARGREASKGNVWGQTLPPKMEDCGRIDAVAREDDNNEGTKKRRGWDLAG